MKYEYLLMEEEDVRTELTEYILDFERRFKKYYNKSSEEKSIWVNEDTGEVRDEPPPIDLEEMVREEEKKREERKLNKFKTKKATPAKFKKLYKKLSSATHPDRGGDPDDFLKIKQAYEDNDLMLLLKFADKYDIDYELEDDDTEILEVKTTDIEKEINRMKSTLAWFWGTADLKGKLQVIRQVEKETKSTVKVDDYPEELQPEKPAEVKLLKE